MGRGLGIPLVSLRAVPSGTASGVDQHHRLWKTLLSLALAMTGASALLGWLDPSIPASPVADWGNPACTEGLSSEETIAATDRNQRHDDPDESLSFTGSYLMAANRQRSPSSSVVPMVLASHLPKPAQAPLVIAPTNGVFPAQDTYPGEVRAASPDWPGYSPFAGGNVAH